MYEIKLKTLRFILDECFNNNLFRVTHLQKLTSSTGRIERARNDLVGNVTVRTTKLITPIYDNFQGHFRQIERKGLETFSVSLTILREPDNYKMLFDLIKRITMEID
jgi:hypothetical protein